MGKLSANFAIQFLSPPNTDVAMKMISSPPAEDTGIHPDNSSTLVDAAPKPPKRKRHRKGERNFEVIIPETEQIEKRGAKQGPRERKQPCSNVAGLNRIPWGGHVTVKGKLLKAVNSCDNILYISYVIYRTEPLANAWMQNLMSSRSNNM